MDLFIIDITEVHALRFSGMNLNTEFCLQVGANIICNQLNSCSTKHFHVSHAEHKIACTNECLLVTCTIVL